MESLESKKTCLLFFVRHGERKDEVEGKQAKMDYKFDPPLSD